MDRVLDLYREFADARRGLVYDKVDALHALTVEMIRGRLVVIEGVPCVGKTTFLHSLGRAVHAHGGAVDVHEEHVDRTMLQSFFANTKLLAYWFQMQKLNERRMFALEHELKHATRAGRLSDEPASLVDRGLAGDLAFAIYHFTHGNISEPEMRSYMSSLTRIRYTPPFLTVYMTAAPEKLVERVKQRGNPDEIAHYDAAYFRAMDECHRTALELIGGSYCVVEWGDSIDGIATKGVPAGRCLEVLERAIASTYGGNIDRLGSFVSGDHDDRVIRMPPRALASSDPDELVNMTKSLVAKHVSSSV